MPGQDQVLVSYVADEVCLLAAYAEPRCPGCQRPLPGPPPEAAAWTAPGEPGDHPRPPAAWQHRCACGAWNLPEELVLRREGRDEAAWQAAILDARAHLEDGIAAARRARAREAHAAALAALEAGDAGAVGFAPSWAEPHIADYRPMLTPGGGWGNIRLVTPWTPVGTEATEAICTHQREMTYRQRTTAVCVVRAGTGEADEDEGAPGEEAPAA